MSTLWNTIYTQCTNVLMENGGFQLGLITDSQFYDLAGEILLDFTSKCGLVKQNQPVTMTANTATYTVPDTMCEVQSVLANNTFLFDTSGYYLDNQNATWPTAQSTFPQEWREDELVPKRIQITPAPNVSGTLSLLGTQIPSGSGITGISGSTTVALVPDSFTPYLKYGILALIFGQDGECKDTRKAQYCQARYAEGIAIATAIMGELYRES